MSRTSAQKAKDAENARARRAARKQAETKAAEDFIEEATTTATDPEAGALAAAIVDGSVLANATVAEVAERHQPEPVGDRVSRYMNARDAHRRGEKGVTLDPPETVIGPERPARERHSRKDLPASYRKALETHRAGKRGKGTKATDEQLIEAARRYQTEGLNLSQAMEAAYWLDGFSIGKGRWEKVTGTVWSAS